MAHAPLPQGGLKFAVVREDAELEAALLVQHVSFPHEVLLVASGGCTALHLLTRFPSLRVTAFDLNPAQLAHVRTKLSALESLPEEARAQAFNVEHDAPDGLNQRGTFEGLFRLLRRFIEEFIAPPAELESYFSPTGTPDSRAELLLRWQTSPYWPAAFAVCFADTFLQAMFGPAATQHALPGSYPGYFQRRFEQGLSRSDAARNPFLQHVFLGRYLARDAPPYVASAGPVPEWATRLTLQPGSLLDVPPPTLARAGLISLSNVFDWSDDALVQRWAEQLNRHARPGAVLLLRQLNNQRPLKPFFSPGWRFDDALGEALGAQDRSLFYERILVAFRTP